MNFRRLFDKPLAVAALVLVPGAAVFAAWALGWTAPAERPLYDWSLRALPSPGPQPVVLVALDEETWRALGQRDPDRTEIAKVLGLLAERKPALVALDLLFLNPKDEAADAALEAAIAAVPTVMASSPAQQLEPLPRFRARAIGVGSIDLASDPDGIVRGVPPPYYAEREGQWVIRRLPISLECARHIWFPAGVPSVEIREEGLFLGEKPFVLSAKRWLIPYTGGEGTLPRLSFQKILASPDLIPDLTGKVVILGNTTAMKHDLFSVPLPVAERRDTEFKTLTTHSMAGIEVHGQALAALLDGRALTAPPRRVEGLLLLGLALLSAILALVPLRPLYAVALWIGGGLLGAGACLLALRAGVVLPLFALGLTWLLYGASSIGYHRWKDMAARRAVEQLFGRYVSPNIARRLLADPSLVIAGGRKKVLTILFSDVRGFTSLSERVAPEQVTEILNLYFTEMMEILFAHDGTYDKFIGDALLAFFGDPVDQPDQTERALACAVAMQERAALLRTRFEAEGKPPLHIGIAINTGPVVVGNHGSAQSWSYTVIGDTVNLASRLQGLAQQDEVILSAETAARIPGLRERYDVEDLDPVRVKGKSEPIPILRVRGQKREVAP